jgi:hypothetical protein
VYVDDADDRWRDDVWTMKYLSGFKWEMLGEQVGTSTFQISSCALSHISITEGKEADKQHTRDKHTKRDSGMRSPNLEPNKENTSETSNWQGYWIRERQEKKPRARPLVQHRTERRMMGGRKKMERRKKGRLLNTGRGKLLIEAKGWRRRVWIMF